MVKENNKETNKKKKEALLSHRSLLKKRKPRFLRHKWYSLPGLGKGRKKKQKWRKPKGRHNKLREKRKSIGRQPSIGFSSPKLVRGTIEGMRPLVIRNLGDMEKIDKTNKEVIAFLASMGMKKKIMIAKKAIELGIDFANFNPKRFLKEADIEMETRKKNRKSMEEKIKVRIEKGKKEKKQGTKTARSEQEVEKVGQKLEEKEIIKPKSEILDKKNEA